MKRSVAILGPTPQFLRWSLGQRCDLRQLESLAPDATFRQLRGVREFSTAKSEGRVFKDICVHPTATSSAPADALGFSAAEVLDSFGGGESIEQCCHRCPANTNAIDSGDSLWAGCFGWLAANGSSLASLASCNGDGAVEEEVAPRTPLDDLLVKETAHAIQMLNLASQVEANFPSASSAWFGFWQSGTLSVPQLLLLEKILSVALRRHETNADPRFVDDLLRLIDAMSLAHRHGLPLSVELVPQGYSDGQTWALTAHCQRCCFSQDESQSEWTACPVCGHSHSPTPRRKFKVLGLRPYVNLSRVLGLEQTKGFLEQYEAAAGRSSSTSPTSH